MARYEFFKVGDKTIAYEISLEDALGRDLFSKLIAVALFALIFGLLVTIIPLILFILYFITVNKTKWIINAIGALLAWYFVVDYTKGWVCWMIYTSFGSDVWYPKFLFLNLSLAITHSILFAFNYFYREKESPVRKFIPFIALIIGLTFGNMLSKDTKKYTPPPKTEEEKKEEKNQMY